MAKTAFVFVFFCLWAFAISGNSNEVRLGEQEGQSRFVSRRSSGGAADYQLRFAHDSFAATTDETVERLIDSHSPVLIHTREKVN